MDSRQPSPNQTKPIMPSVTAPAVLSGFQRSLIMGYGHLFSPLDLKLATHFIQAARAAYPPLTINRLLLESITRMPFWMQSSFFDAKTFKAYDHLILLRKLMIKQSIEQAIDSNFTQIVILGGGYDVRALVAGGEFPHIKFFEIDRNPTRQTKIDALKTLPAETFVNTPLSKATLSIKENGTVTVGGNIHFIECDLATTPLKDCLLTNGFNPHEETFVIAEGVLPYLNVDAVNQLLNQIFELCEHNRVFALLGHMDKHVYTETIKSRQGDSGELWNSYLPPEEAIAFFAEQQFEMSFKFELASHLDLLDDQANQAYYEASHKEPREMYYLLKKGLTDLRELDITKVPNIPVKGSEPIEENIPSMCSVL